MLDPKKNRLDYGTIVSPPNGFELDHAIGMTYSMDLYALLALPVAMFYSSAVSGENDVSRYDILDAIHQCAGKIDVFCQKGKIAASKHNKLLGFLEESIIEVLPPNAVSSFHPKLWLLRFASDDKVIYRLIVLRRNLTFDRSWDLAFHTDGKVLDKVNPESLKLSNFLSYFYGQSDRNMHNSIREELANVEFEVPSGFDELKIWPICYFDPALNLANPLENHNHKRMLVFSPFIDKTTFKKFFLGNRGGTNTRNYLISRKEELDKITIPSKSLDNIYTLKEEIIEGENRLDDTEGFPSVLQELHAKIWVGNQDDRSDWYIGSANATLPAFERNTEMLIQISCAQYGKGFGNWRRKLLGEDVAEATPNKFSYYQKYNRTQIEPVEDTETHKLALRHLIHDIMQIQCLGVLQEQENGNFVITINFDLSDINHNDIVNEISLYRSDNSKHKKSIILGESNTISFANIGISDLSKFITLEIGYGENEIHRCTIMIDVNIPEERNATILKDLINDRTKFLKYIQFILSPETNTSSLEIDTTMSLLNNEEVNILEVLLGSHQGIYESLMVAASRNPKKLKRIDSIITKLKSLDGNIVKDFLPIWDTFKSFAS